MEIPGLTDLERIGAGSFAVVYRGRQEAMSRDVAVKVLREELTDDDEARFERECRTLGSLSHHPNIVTLYGSGVTAEGRGYLILEYCPGSVHDRVQSSGPMPWRDVAVLLAAVSDAVAFAHDQGVLHRDIKPHNILYSSFDTPQLADFGIARMDDEFQTGSGAFTGSLAFMAPEIFNGEPASAVADVWSLASTAYSLLLGHPPFSRDDDEVVTAVIMRAQTDDPPALAPLGVPAEMESLLTSALARNAADRVPSASALAAGFRDLAGGDAPTAQATLHRALPLPPPPGPPPAYAHTVQERGGGTSHFAASAPPSLPTAAPVASAPPPPSTAQVPPPVTPTRGRGWILAVVAVIAVAVAAVGGFLYFGGDDDEQASSSTTTEPDETTTTEPDETTTTIPPTRRLTLTDASASSTATGGIDSGGSDVTYDPANFLDGRADTTWRAPGDGVGETVSFTAPGTGITRIGMIPGYDKVDPVDGADRFTENRRVLEIEWTFADGSTLRQTFEDSRDLQLIDVDAPAGPVTGEILDSTDFDRRDFVAISEIVVQGY